MYGYLAWLMYLTKSCYLCHCSRFLHSWCGKYSLRYSHSSTYSYLTGKIYPCIDEIQLCDCLQTPEMLDRTSFDSYQCHSLLLRRECCSFSNGEYVKAGLAELEHWCYRATDEVNIAIFCHISENSDR